jgi:orotidine-5'-phosphate decarboxylase
VSLRSALARPRSDTIHQRLIVALDVDTKDEAERLVVRLRGSVRLFKVGKQLFLSSGPEVVRMIHRHGGEVFLDLKFHDIPHTVAKAGIEAARLGVRFFDLHASGSFEMMKRTAVEVTRVCRRDGLRRPKILAVTVLTSLGKADLRRVGVTDEVEHQVVRLARLADRAGMDGVVASPLEIARIRRACGRGFLIVTPGVRPARAARDDQKRIMTPGEAIHAGADYLVVGRPIRDAPDPLAVVRELAADMARGLP